MKKLMLLLVCFSIFMVSCGTETEPVTGGAKGDTGAAGNNGAAGVDGANGNPGPGGVTGDKGATLLQASFFDQVELAVVSEALTYTFVATTGAVATPVATSEGKTVETFKADFITQFNRTQFVPVTRGAVSQKYVKAITSAEVTITGNVADPTLFTADEVITITVKPVLEAGVEMVEGVAPADMVYTFTAAA